MLVVPTWVVENSYIPPPWMVSHSIFGLLILEDQQIDLHPQTSSNPSCSVTFSSPLSWLPDGSPDCFLNQNFLPLKREIHQKCLLEILQHLVFYAIFGFCLHIENECSPNQSCDHSCAISHLYFRSIFLQALHPLFDVLYAAMGSSLSSLFLGGILATWPMFSFPQWCLWWLNNLPGQCSLSFPPELVSQPN